MPNSTCIAIGCSDIATKSCSECQTPMCDKHQTWIKYPDGSELLRICPRCQKWVDKWNLSMLILFVVAMSLFLAKCLQFDGFCAIH